MIEKPENENLIIIIIKYFTESKILKDKIQLVDLPSMET